MRSLKTNERLTRGTGIGETERLVWLLSMPACVEISLAMQLVTGVYFTSIHLIITKMLANPHKAEITKTLKSSSLFSRVRILSAVTKNFDPLQLDKKQISL